MSGKKEILNNKTMRHILTLEKFTKQYQQKIDVKDFKKIKKGSKILYMGGQVEVLKNDGYVLTLKGKDGKKFTVNKSMFDHGGMIKEGIMDNIHLMADASKDYEDFKKKFKKGFPKIFKPTPDFMDWLYGMYKDMAPDKVEEVYDGKKKKKKKPFHPDVMYESKGRKVVSDIYAIDGQIDYLSDADAATKKIWKKAGVNPNDDNMIILYSYVNNWIPTKKILDKSRIKYKELEDPNSAGESFIVFNVNEALNEKANLKSLAKDLAELDKGKGGMSWISSITVEDDWDNKKGEDIVMISVQGGAGDSTPKAYVNKFLKKLGFKPKFFKKNNKGDIHEYIWHLTQFTPDDVDKISWKDLEYYRESVVNEDYSQRARNFRVRLRARLEAMKKGEKISYGKLSWTALGNGNFKDSRGRTVPYQDIVQDLKFAVQPDIMKHRGARGDEMIDAYLTFESKVNEARAKKVTKQMWKRMNDDKRFDALLSVVKDPDDAEEYVEYKWKNYLVALNIKWYYLNYHLHKTVQKIRMVKVNTKII